MKDFIKIFVFLLVVVIAFVFGRNYGEQTITASDEFKTNRDAQEKLIKAEQDLKQTQDKLQNLLDSADLKKADELFTKIMTLFLVDLGLRISEERQKDLDIGKASLARCISPAAEPMKAIKKNEPTPKPAEEKTDKEKKWAKISPSRFKSKEWILRNSDNDSAIQRNLKDLNLTALDEYIRSAPAGNIADIAIFEGVYRGAVIDVTNKEYGSLVIEIKLNNDRVTGAVKFFRNGNTETSANFNSQGLGLKPKDYSGVIINVGERYIQIYKISHVEKIAGYFYERLPNGTSKTIGSFVLSRTDRF